MTEPTAVTIHFMNELQDHLQAQRLLYRQSFFARADKVVSLLLFGFGVYAVAAAGLRWWTGIWFPLAVAELLEEKLPRSG